MRKICPQCQASFDTQFLCPACGLQLLEMPDRSAVIAGRPQESIVAAPGMAVRFLAGLILAQGLYYGLRLWAAAFSLAFAPAEDFALTISNVLAPGLMAVAVLAGALVAGSGNPRGLAAGAALGLLHAFLIIGAEFAVGLWPTKYVLFSGWLVLTLLGAIGGRVGRYLWPPLSDIPDPSQAAETKPVSFETPSLPIAWARVIGGAALSIGCTVWAGAIRDFMIGTSDGKFMVESRFQSQFVAWVISALAMMVGGVFAGASTRSGLKHGFLVGLFSCIGIFIIHSFVVKESIPAEKFFAAVFGLPETDALTPARLGLYLLSNALFLGMFGGWFGASLLPRLIQPPSRLDRGAI